ncbi:DoxX family protein [Thalassotalea ponticola]|uniref:HvfX family Cu-binding RiPP maturation protein n=1 Tax=Thalassotalea ponticola TaxID=1523392 RepID=UPI0025B495CD|nr:DoxX family protein [Thalassotalea ponticola]MDN3651513.1 DoxX family protein [Thalassotalea ponticola]
MLSIYRAGVSWLLSLDAIPALLIRLFLAPVFIIAGYNKLQISNSDLTWSERLLADPDIVQWFGNSEWGLGLPYPEILANAAAWTEFFGGWLLLAGLATRFVCIGLMITMIVAATTVHWHNGWYAITPTNSETSSANVLAWLGSDHAKDSLANSDAAAVRLERIKSILNEHGNPDWLFETGNVVLLNNGIEFAATYFILLLALFFIGPGRWVSVDYYLCSSTSKTTGET